MTAGAEVVRAGDHDAADEVAPAVRCENLVRIFQRGRGQDRVEVVALQGLDLSVGSGEMVAVVGASGSGKSTLLSILSGLDRPTAGRAVVAGHDLALMSERARVRYQREVVGIVWQATDRAVLPYLTAQQNVSLPMVLARRRPADRAARARELLAAVGVADLADRRPAEMSGGQRQRVAIAAALANGPSLLLADEPTGALDSATTEEVMEVLRRVNAETGTTVLVVTHDPVVAAGMPRTIRIRDGRTASEVHRRTVTLPDGSSEEVVSELAVLDRSGTLQLSREHVDALGLRDHVRVELRDDHVELWPHAAGEPG